MQHVETAPKEQCRGHDGRTFAQFPVTRLLYLKLRLQASFQNWPASLFQKLGVVLKVADFSSHLFVDQVHGCPERLVELNRRVTAHSRCDGGDWPRFEPEAEFSRMNLADAIVLLQVKGVMNECLDRDQHSGYEVAVFG